MSEENVKIYDELIGKTFTEVKNIENNALVFKNKDHYYRFYHMQDCCENVQIVDVVGDLSDLVGAPIVMAEEVRHDNFVPDEVKDKEEYYDDSFTWTFYKFATEKGYVTVRWLGESNGYYGTQVDFGKGESIW